MKPKTYFGPAWVLLTAAAVLYVIDAPYAATERVKPGYTACISEQHLAQFSTATHRVQVAMMMRNECLSTDRLADHPFSQLDDGRVRLYLPDDQYADMYLSGGV